MHHITVGINHVYTYPAQRVISACGVLRGNSATAVLRCPPRQRLSGRQIVHPAQRADQAIPKCPPSRSEATEANTGEHMMAMWDGSCHHHVIGFLMERLETP